MLGRGASDANTLFTALTIVLLVSISGVMVPFGGITLEAAADQVAAHRPDVLGVSATTISITNGAQIAAAVRARLPKLLTVVGGPHVSAAPEATLRAFPEFDYGISGEGELAFFALLDALAAGERPDDLTGVIARTDDGGVIANARAPYIDDVDSLPFPAWDLLGDAFPQVSPHVGGDRPTERA